ncbi:unnamed protein product [Toxocara canis]|uniref:Uncharacterized protein n=1 Tax=Toxocara canis TaxID=6265 RepID=A0A3P7IIN4_TOXCA|nr:unnamed protein product [Toxocara canis]
MSSELELEGRFDVVANPVDDCPTILSQLEWTNLTEVKRGMKCEKSEADEHERTPSLIDAQTSRSAKGDVLRVGRKDAFPEAGGPHVDRVDVPGDLTKTPVHTLMCPTPQSSGRSWHLVKPNRRKNRKKLVFNE